MPRETGEKCGVFGVYAPDEDVATMAYLGLHALQHRGQQGAGIGVGDGEGITLSKGIGLVNEAFGGGNRLRELLPSAGKLAVGHTLYGTTNGQKPVDVERLAPVRNRATDPAAQFILGSNGHIEKLAAAALKYNFELDGIPSDTHAITESVGRELEEHGDMVKALQNALPLFEGAYSMVIATAESLFAVRDPYGFRPLHLGRLASGGFVVASEIPALNIVHAIPEREVEPGEIIEINDNGISTYNMGSLERSVCGFEFVYFSRPDNRIEGELVAKVRKRIGRILARNDDTAIDLVCGVPKSGQLAADGYAWARGVPNEMAIVKNEYVGRTFITSGQSQREAAVRQKLNVIDEYVKGKRICVVDDSVVRGTTTKVIVKMLREAGALEVHLRIASPPYMWPCYFGMNTRDRSKLIAAQLNVDEICELVGADSLRYLPQEGLTEALGSAGSKVCNACTTGNYPIQIY